LAFLHLTSLLKVTTATVGIRGTVFDLACGKADATDNPPQAELTDAECNQSLFASTRAGEITLASADRREVSMPAGQVVLGSYRSSQSEGFLMTQGRPMGEYRNAQHGGFLISAAPRRISG
jgi:hypothetical protein